MRSIDETRERLIRSSGAALACPAMWGGSDVGIQQSFEIRLGLLCWIDQCEDKLRRARLKCPTSDPLGIVGALACQHFNWPDYGNEVASVYAQIVQSLGYWRAERFLDATEWTDLQESLSAEFFCRDWTKSQILQRFGTPSYKAGGSFTIVLGYAPSGDEPWICFDFARKVRPANTEPWLDDPCLRDVRIGSLTMTPLPLAREKPIGREIISDVNWRTVAPRLEDLLDRETVDIVPVILEVRGRFPDVRVERIRCCHHCDIYAAWYFSLEAGGPEIELCSLYGFAPFFVTIPQHPPKRAQKGFAHSRDEAIEAVVEFLATTGAGHEVLGDV